MSPKDPAGRQRTKPESGGCKSFCTCCCVEALTFKLCGGFVLIDVLGWRRSCVRSNAGEGGMSSLSFLPEESCFEYDSIWICDIRCPLHFRNAQGVQIITFIEHESSWVTLAVCIVDSSEIAQLSSSAAPFRCLRCCFWCSIGWFCPV